MWSSGDFDRVWSPTHALPARFFGGNHPAEGDPEVWILYVSVDVFFCLYLWYLIDMHRYARYAVICIIYLRFAGLSFKDSSVVPWRATSYPSLHSLCQSVCIFGGLSICLSQLYWSVHINLTQSTWPVYLSILLGCIRITYEDISWYIKIQGRMLSNSGHLTLPLSLFPYGTMHKKSRPRRGSNAVKVHSLEDGWWQGKTRWLFFWTNDTYPYGCYHRLSLISLGMGMGQSAWTHGMVLQR